MKHYENAFVEIVSLNEKDIIVTSIATGKTFDLSLDNGVNFGNLNWK